MQGEQLSRVPKGFAGDHPAADLLRYKQFLYYVELAPEIASTKEIAATIGNTSAQLHSLLSF